MSTAVTILGNTGRDVELRYTPQGVAVANFSVASNTVRNTASGQQKKTDWFNVTAFGKQAETLARHLKKGSQVLVRGKLSFNPWLSRDGEARVSADVALQDFEFAGGANGANTGRAATVETEETASATGNSRRDSEVEDAPDAGELTAEMIEALRETEIGGDEPFAGQF
jgi:single-strand DNA-binding protein